MRLLLIASVAHAVNLAWCSYNGDTSQVPWADAPEWQRDSAVNGVRFHLEHPEATDSASHDNWMAEKLAAGWTYGEVKDPDAKTHPCLVPFDQLPREQQFKDLLFRTIVRAFADGNEFDGLEAAFAELREAHDANIIAMAKIGEDLDAARAESSRLAAELAAKDDAPSVEPVARSGKPRKVGPLKNGSDRDAIAEAIAEGEPLELVFSDGKAEIIGIAPLKVARNSWEKGPFGFVLVPHVRLDGPAPGKSDFLVKGVGVFDAGEQIGWAPLHEPVTVPAGRVAELRRSIII